MSKNPKPSKKAKQAAETDGLIAEFYTQPLLVNALPLSAIARKMPVQGESGTGALDLAGKLRVQAKNIANGDLGSIEEMLIGQATSLQLFHALFLHKAVDAEYMGQLDTYARIALKAQNQCRQTLSALAEIKNPRRATFVKQQNNAQYQQVNNQSENSKNSDNSANELLEDLPNERLEYGAAETPSGVNQTLETVGKINGAE